MIMGALLLLMPSVVARAEADDPMVISIVEDLVASGSMDGGGESVVRYLIGKDLDPAGELYADLGLKLYDQGHDEASAAVFAAHYLKTRRTKAEPEPALPAVTPSPAWRPTHRVRLTNGQLMKGVPHEPDAAGFWLETEPGSRVRLESSETLSTEPLDQES